MDAVFPVITAGSDRMIKAVVFVKNPGACEIPVKPEAFLRSASGKEIRPISATTSTSLPKGAIAFALPLSITLPKLKPSDFPLNGWLILRDPQPPGTVLTAKPLEIKGILGPSTGAEWMMFRWALIFAGAGVFLAGLIAVRRGGGLRILSHRMGKPEWTFTGSWSSTITIAGAVVTSLLSFSGLPEQGEMLSKKSYFLISLMLGALVGLAPGIYSLFSKTVQAKDDNGISVVESQGYVLLFLVAALFTVTGVMAQLGLLQFLFSDVAAVGVLSLPMARFWWYLLRGLQIILLIHAMVSIVQTIRAQSLPAADAEGAQPDKIQRSGVRLDANTLKDVKPQLPGWSLL